MHRIICFRILMYAGDHYLTRESFFLPFVTTLLSILAALTMNEHCLMQEALKRAGPAPLAARLEHSLFENPNEFIDYSFKNCTSLESFLTSLGGP